MIGASELAKMKPTSILINTARGKIIDETALVEALQAKRIAGAGLDVFEKEPLPLNSPLMELENVVLTPHIAFPFEGINRRVHRYLRGERGDVRVGQASKCC
jgi:D-3-phosphoglycerate dehydrogenase